MMVTAGLLITWIQSRASESGTTGMHSSSRAVEPCPEANRDTCEEAVAVQSAVAEVVLSSASVCVDVGYLCAEVERTDSLRILRWPEGTGRLRIRVPLPSGVAPARARDLQSAVVRGLQYWQRRPFELVIDTNPTSSALADIEITWGGLSGTQLGFTHTELSFQNGEFKFEVLSLTLALRSPANLNLELAPVQVLLTAAHEMGHALGLPHSDSARDVMYPTNTARSLSTRDFRTLDAVYRFPNGAVIRKAR